MDNAKVSVIVPCYCVEKYLDRCMESLVNQTLTDIEIILVDDKSPDRVPAMCDEWGKRDSRIKVVHKEVNGGLGLARNTGLELAAGEYVAFVDSDDFVELDMYDTLYNKAKEADADVVFSNTYHEEQPGHWTITQEVTKLTEWKGEHVLDFLKDMIACEPVNQQERRFRMSVWHSIYRRGIIEQHNIRFRSEREVMSEDFPFQVDYLKRAQKVVYVPEAYYHYCLNGTSLTNTFSTEKFDRILCLYNLMCSQLKDNDGFQVRLDRFYIGYVRARIQDLLLSDTDEKNEWIKYACDQLIKTGIHNRYPTDSMPKNHLLFYKLVINKDITGIRILCKLMMIIKRIKGMMLQ